MSVKPAKDASKSPVKLKTMAIDWAVVMPKLKERWSRLTDGDLRDASGKIEVLVGKLEIRYGLESNVASRELDDFMREIVRK